ncbi:MAG: NTPase [Thermoproteota archaeon]
MKRIFLLTGKPGIGKTTALINIIELLRRSDVDVGGVVSREVRVDGIRKGFEIVDVLTNRVGTLANIAGNGPRLGKYRVNLKDISSVGVSALKSSMERADVVVIDEIGPMELFSKEFMQSIREVLGCGKPVVGTVHSNLRHPIMEEVNKRPDVDVFEVTYSNREKIPRDVVERVLLLLGR